MIIIFTIVDTLDNIINTRLEKNNRINPIVRMNESGEREAETEEKRNYKLLCMYNYVHFVKIFSHQWDRAWE